MVTIYVPDIPEFQPLIAGAEKAGGCTVIKPLKGYWQLESATEICFYRKELGLGPALWNSALMGGFRGEIIEYDRNVLRIAEAG
jgi:hypothetical protein